MHLEPLHHKIRRPTAPCIITPLAQTQYANYFISVLYCCLPFHIQFIKISLFLFRSFQFHLAHLFSKLENLRQFKSDVETAIRDFKMYLNTESIYYLFIFLSVLRRSGSGFFMFGSIEKSQKSRNSGDQDLKIPKFWNPGDWDRDRDMKTSKNPEKIPRAKSRNLTIEKAPVY